MQRIDTVSGRRSLKLRREPYWRRISEGLHIGYRVLAEGEGTWIGRRRRDDGKQIYHSLGHVETYDQAEKAVREWAVRVEAGVSHQDVTVADVFKSYIAYLRTDKAKTTVKTAEGCFNRLIAKKPIARIPLSKLQTIHVKAWLDGQVAVASTGTAEQQAEIVRRSKVTANRNLECLRAALNRAMMDRLVLTDAGWRTVRRFKKVNRRREKLLTREERLAILEKCTPALRAFCTVLALTGIRPGDLAGCSVRDFDPVQGTLGVSGKTERRTITLSTQTTQFLTQYVGQRHLDTPLLVTAYGTRWTREVWGKWFKRAVEDAGLDQSIVLYHFRHATISELILNGMDSFVVAKQASTSVQMIEAYYGHLRTENVRKAMDSVVLL